MLKLSFGLSTEFLIHIISYTDSSRKSSKFNFRQKLQETGYFILKNENVKELQLKQNLIFFSEIVHTCSPQ